MLLHGGFSVNERPTAIEDLDPGDRDTDILEYLELGEQVHPGPL
jgi:hypothetical protein